MRSGLFLFLCRCCFCCIFILRSSGGADIYLSTALTPAIACWGMPCTGDITLHNITAGQHTGTLQLKSNIEGLCLIVDDYWYTYTDGNNNTLTHNISMTSWLGMDPHPFNATCSVPRGQVTACAVTPSRWLAWRGCAVLWDTTASVTVWS